MIFRKACSRAEGDAKVPVPSGRASIVRTTWVGPSGADAANGSVRAIAIRDQQTAVTRARNIRSDKRPPASSGRCNGRLLIPRGRVSLYRTRIPAGAASIFSPPAFRARAP